MGDEHTDGQAAGEGLSAALVACLEALEGGGPVDRGELLARYPQHAAELARFLDDQERVDRCAAPLRAAVQGSPIAGQPPDPATLGDFRIVREVGRGGMGVVYEAEQVSLRRRVALKVLPFAATMDPRQLQRFHNEAQAAACLHHTNIVPVHAVGSERGVHFYAMQFIDGQPLSEVVRQLRRAEQDKAPGGPQPEGAPANKDRTTAYLAGEEDAPAAATGRAAADETPLTTEGRRGREYFRKVAELGVQAAEALDHAHQLGIVHRDVKPANLLLDGGGRLWVTDFGLAHMQQGEATLTRTGDLVGTLRYMSPEQALAKRVVIDHRTDVYSLGATLYELLTLQPAFRGEDRQELLRQIAFEEPVKPRRLDRALPAELETIVLKALEKNPADRYATAQELADDLRHWLEDRPIRARRPSWSQVAARWARRHRAVVWSAAAVLLVAAMFAGGTWASWTQRWAEARSALGEAHRLLEQERWPEALSAARRAAGVLAGVGADVGLRRQAEELTKDLEMAQRLQEIHLLGTGVKDGHFDQEEACAAYSRAFRWYGLDADSLDARAAGERIRARPIHRQLIVALDYWAVAGSGTGAQGSTWAAAAVRAADRDEWRNRLRDACHRKDSKAVDELLASSPAEGGTLFVGLALGLRAREGAAGERALALLRQAQVRHPDDFWACFALASHLYRSRPPRLEEAARCYAVAVALRPQSPGARLNLGAALKDRGDLDAATAQYREAIRLKRDYAEAHSSLGDALRLRGLLDEALAECREALRLKPSSPAAHCNLGLVLREKDRLDEALAECREAVRLDADDPVAHQALGLALYAKGRLDEAVAEYGEALRLRPDYPEAHSNLGAARLRQGKVDEAIAECREALRLKSDFPEAHINLGGALAFKGRLDEAIGEFQEALRLKPDAPTAHFNFGTALAHKGQLDEAIKEFREAIRLKEDDPDAHYILGVALRDKGRLDEAIAEFREAIRINKDFARAHFNLGNALKNKGQMDEAIAEYREALRLKKDYAEAHCNLGSALLQQGQFRDAVEELRRGHQLGSRNPHWPHPSAQWVRDAERWADFDARLPRVLRGQDRLADAGDRLTVAVLCQQHKKLFASAARWYGKAFAADPRLTLDLAAGHRYNAACAAALAAAGQGKDADKLESKERARLRQQALDWLRADLGAWRTLLEKEPEKVRPVIIKQLRHWQEDPDFAGVRGPEALAKLPEAERQAWHKLWADVADTLAAAQQKTQRK